MVLSVALLIRHKIQEDQAYNSTIREESAIKIVVPVHLFGLISHQISHRNKAKRGYFKT